MIVVTCPGQGSQTPGFLSPWLEVAGVTQELAALSEACGVDLVRHGTHSDAETIRDTAIAQPLIVAAGVVTLQALFGGSVVPAGVGIAGHSVGEFTAAAGAGVLSTTDAVRLVGVRGRAMADAASQVATGMSAIVGGDEKDVMTAVESAGLFPANYNGGGQLVAAGELTGLAALAATPPAGARVIPLQVAGAFHTKFMAPAVETLRQAASATAPVDPQAMLWTNRDGSLVTSGAEFIDLLVGQVASPVRWDLCMDSFAAAGVTGIIELAPAGALVGLAKRGLKGVPSVAVKTPDDLETAGALLSGEGI